MSLLPMLRVGNNKSFLPFLVNVRMLSTCCVEPQHQWCGRFIALQNACYTECEKGYLHLTRWWKESVSRTMMWGQQSPLYY